MTTLTEFLLARIAEDEAEVEREDARQTEWMNAHVGASVAIEWFHPGRLLAECEAKRIIASDLADARGQNLATEWGRSARHGLEIAARAIALPYADHSDYDEDWRP